MKTLAARKIVAIFTAVSLAFLQAVPAGVAATKPVEEAVGTGVPTSEKAVTDASAPQQAPAAVVAPAAQTSTDFMSNASTLSKPSRDPVIEKPVEAIKTPVETPVLIGPPVSSSEETSFSEETVKPIVDAVQNDLAGRLEVPAESVTVVNIVSVTWNDSCLGVSTGQNCKMVPTPGYNITLNVDGVKYVYHTNTREHFIFVEKTDSIETPEGKVTPFPGGIEVTASTYGMANNLSVSVAENGSATIVLNGTTYTGQASLQVTKPGGQYVRVEAQGAAGQIFQVRFNQTENGWALVSLTEIKSQDISNYHLDSRVNYEFGVVAGTYRMVRTFSETQLHYTAPATHPSGASVYGGLNEVIYVYDETGNTMEITSKITRINDGVVVPAESSVRTTLFFNDGVARTDAEIEAILAARPADESGFKQTFDVQVRDLAAWQRGEQMAAIAREWTLINGKYLKTLDRQDVFINNAYQALQYQSFKYDSDGNLISHGVIRYFVLENGRRGQVNLGGKLVDGVMQYTAMLPSLGRIRLTGVTPEFGADGLLSGLRGDIVGADEHATVTITAEGALITRLPTAVQAYVDQMQEALGKTYVVSAILKDGSYAVTVNFRTHRICLPGASCPKVILLPKPGQLTHMSFTLAADGTLNLKTLEVSYAVTGKLTKVIDAQLLYTAIGACITGRPCPKMAISPVSRLIRMAQSKVTSVDESGSIFFTMNEKNYKAYRDENGNVKLDEIDTIPAPVQAYAEQLQAQLGDNYAVTVTPGKVRGTYVVSFVSAIKQALQGHLGSASLVLNEDGSFAAFTSATFAGMEMTNADAQLLFEGLRTFARKNDIRTDIQALKFMTQISVTKVENSAIFFTKDEVSYKVYRDENGVVKVGEVALSFPDGILEAAQANLSETELAQLKQAMLDFGPNSEYSIQMDGHGGQSWVWTSADGKTTYVLAQEKIRVVIGISEPQQYQEEIRWSFSAKTQVSKEELLAAAANLQAEQRAQFEASIANLPADTVFTKTVSGNDVSYQWGNPQNLAVTYIVSIEMVTIQNEDGTVTQKPEIHFSIQTQIGPGGIAQYAQNLTDEAQKAQFMAALADIGPNSEYSMQIDDTNGAKSWIWTSADGKTTYVLNERKIKIQNGDETYEELVAWSFSAQEIVGLEELQAYAAQLSVDQQDAFNQAIANTPAGTVFTKVVSGNDVSYQWGGTQENRPATFIISVGPNGEIRFSISIKVYTLAMLGEYAQNLTDEAQKAQFVAALEDGILMQVTHYSDGGQSWTLKSKTNPAVTYILEKAMVRIMQDDGAYATEMKWSFSSKTQISREEIEQYGGQLTGEQLAQFQSALANLPADTVFTKTTSGNDVSYSWGGTQENRPATFIISVGPNGEIRFSISIKVYTLAMLGEYAQNLTDEAQKAQFVAALEDGILMQVTHYSDGGQSWTLKSKTNPAVTYILEKAMVRIMQDDGAYATEMKWSFSSKTQISREEIEQYGGQLTGEQLAQFQSALANLPADTVFTKTTSGNDVSYSWGGTKDDRPATYVISVGPNGELSFSVQIDLNAPEMVPPAVQQIQAEFQKLGFTVKIGLIKTLPLQYSITIVDAKIYVKAPTSGLHGMSFEVAADGTIKPETLVADYYAADAQTVQVKDGKLLYEAVTVCPQGQACTMQAVTPLSSLLQMAQITVTKVENDLIAFTKEGKNYKAYRKDGQVIVINTSTIDEAIARVAEAQERLQEAQEALERAQANVDAALSQIRTGEHMKAEAEKMLEMATDFQKAAEAAFAQANRLYQLYQSEINAGADDQNAANHEQNEINKLQNKINVANKCIGGNIDVCKANGWTVLQNQAGEWYVPESTKRDLTRNIAEWRADQAAASRRAEAYFKSAAEHYKKAQAYAAQYKEMLSKAKEFLDKSATYQQKGQTLLAEALKMIEAGKVNLDRAQRALTIARDRYVSAASALREAVEYLRSLPGYGELLQEAKVAVTEAQRKLEEALRLLDRANQAMASASAELKAAEQMKAEAEKMLQMAAQLQKAAEGASNQGAQLAQLANAEVNAAQDAQKAAEAEQAAINKLQNSIGKANSCIGGNIDVCRANGWTVLRDSKGNWYVPNSTKQELLQKIAVWTKEISQRSAKKADLLRKAADHYKRSKNYTEQSSAMYAKAKEYLSKARDYISRGQAMMAQALERIKIAQLRIQQAQRNLVIARQHHMTANAAFRTAVERLEMLQPKIVIGIELAGMPK